MRDQAGQKIKPGNKFIILDFDGVCTEYGGKTGSYITHSPESYGFSEIPVHKLKNLIRMTGAKVIISSNWRKFTTDPDLLTSYWIHPEYGKLLNPLPKLLNELGDAFSGMFPAVRHIRKPEAFRLWLDKNGVSSDNIKYVIFDDDKREGFETSEFADHFILTDPETGLTPENVKRAISVLT